MRADTFRAGKLLCHEKDHPGICEQNNLRPHTDPVKKWDLEIGLKDIPDTINELNRYAPFGDGNPMPVIKVSDFQVIPQNGYYFRTMTYDGVKFTSSEGTEAVGFGFASDLADKKPKELVLYGTLGENYFRGQIKPQISFDDVELIREV